MTSPVSPAIIGGIREALRRGCLPLYPALLALGEPVFSRWGNDNALAATTDRGGFFIHPDHFHHLTGGENPKIEPEKYIVYLWFHETMHHLLRHVGSRGRVKEFKQLFAPDGGKELFEKIVAAAIDAEADNVVQHILVALFPSVDQAVKQVGLYLLPDQLGFSPGMSFEMMALQILEQLKNCPKMKGQGQGQDQDQGQGESQDQDQSQGQGQDQDQDQSHGQGQNQDQGQSQGRGEDQDQDHGQGQNQDQGQTRGPDRGQEDKGQCSACPYRLICTRLPLSQLLTGDEESVRGEQMGIPPGENFLQEALEQIFSIGNIPAGLKRFVSVQGRDNSLCRVVSQVVKATRQAIQGGLGANIDPTVPNPPLSQIGWTLGGVQLPGESTPQIGIGFVVDTSGSMPELFIKKSIQAILGVVTVQGPVLAVSCDTEAYYRFVVRGHLHEFPLYGGGGTALWAGVQAILERPYPPGAPQEITTVIILTDGYSDWPSDEEAQETIPDNVAIFVVLLHQGRNVPKIPSFGGRLKQVVSLAVE